MVNENVKSFYDNAAVTYSDDHNDRFCDRLIDHFLIQSVPVGKDNLKVLDAGAGIGRFASSMLKQGHQVVLLDISKRMLDEAKKRLVDFSDISYCCGSVERMPFCDNSFDVILMMNQVLSLCGDYSSATKEANRVLKSRGTLIGTVGNRFAYARKLLSSEDYTAFDDCVNNGTRYVTWEDNLGGYNSHEFTIPELSGLLFESGFVIERLLGIFNLHDKYTLDQVVQKNELFKRQVAFANLPGYIYHSDDFFFVARKR